MEENCKDCNQRLKTRHTIDKMMLVCINSGCKNYWINQGSQIIMMLK